MHLSSYWIEMTRDHARAKGVELERAAAVSNSAMDAVLVRLTLVVDLSYQKKLMQAKLKKKSKF